MYGSGYNTESNGEADHVDDDPDDAHVRENRRRHVLKQAHTTMLITQL